MQALAQYLYFPGFSIEKGVNPSLNLVWVWGEHISQRAVFKIIEGQLEQQRQVVVVGVFVES